MKKLKQIIKEAILEALYEVMNDGVSTMAATPEGTGGEGDNNNGNNSGGSNNGGSTGGPIEPQPTGGYGGFSLKKP